MKLKLGIVTFNIAKDWDVDTIITKCTDLGYEGVELRTTHHHKAEVNLSEEQRKEIRNKFEDSFVKLVGLGSVFEYHSPIKEELRKNIEGTKEYIKLAYNVGAKGVKVRPNSFPEEVSKEKTIEQIDLSLRECGEFAQDYGIKVRLEVHGKGTCFVPYIKQMIDVCNHANVYVCWNCNPTDVDKSGSIRDNFNLVRDKIELVHMHDLYEGYPYEELFSLLKDIGYEGFYLAEIPDSPEPEKILKYYQKLFYSF